MRKITSKTSKQTRKTQAERQDDKLRRALAELNRLTGAPLKVGCRGGRVFVDLR